MRKRASRVVSRPRREPYPEPQERRIGCKVSWYYYKSKADAEKASKAAQTNAADDMLLGYDFGYCSPGSIYGPDKQGFYPGLYEVCIP